MSTRRPLATVPNGTNSPHRVSSSTAIKRPRAGPQYDPVYEPPPSKRQLLEQERSRTELQYDPEYCPPPSKKQVVEHKRISEVQYDSAYVPPASRKQLVEPERPESRSPSKIRYTYVNEGKTVDRGGGSPQKVLVDRKLQAARAKEQQSSKEKEKRVFSTQRVLMCCELTYEITGFSNGADIIGRLFLTSFSTLTAFLQMSAASAFETCLPLAR